MSGGETQGRGEGVSGKAWAQGLARRWRVLPLRSWKEGRKKAGSRRGDSSSSSSVCSEETAWRCSTASAGAWRWAWAYMGW